MTPASLSDIVLAAARSVFAARGLDSAALPEATTVERPRNPEHGDYASTLALQLGKRVGVAPRELAAAMAEELGWQPGITLEAGLSRTIDYFQRLLRSDDAPGPRLRKAIG